ncbi:MAG TPA: hypothetical protein VF190_04030 [Rhodothermales bacterium]
MFFTPDRLLLIAVVITLISVDGLYRAWKQRGEERIGVRLFAFYATALGVGTVLVWTGFFAVLLR